jgi:hypothetical protein
MFPASESIVSVESFVNLNESFLMDTLLGQ